MAVESELGHRPGLPLQAAGGIDIDAAASQCIAEAEFLAGSGLSLEQYAIWCRCSAQMIADGFTTAEADFVRQNGANSPEFARLVVRARQSCFATARYLGGAAAPQD